MEQTAGSLQAVERRGFRRGPFVVTILVVGIAAFVLGPILWPPSPASPPPPSGLLPFFIVLAAIEALALGVGVAFLGFGWPLVERSGLSRGQARAMHLAITWFLVNWWAHDNLHIAVGLDYAGLLAIEYGFHVTLIAAGAVLAYNFAQLLRSRA